MSSTIYSRAGLAFTQAANQKNSTRKNAIVFAIAFATMFFASMIWTLSRSGETAGSPSPWNVDGIFYANIAFNINRGEGFAVDLFAQPWRESYIQCHRTTAVTRIQSTTGFGPSKAPAQRPYAFQPAYPYCDESLKGNGHWAESITL